MPWMPPARPNRSTLPATSGRCSVETDERIELFRSNEASYYISVVARFERLAKRHLACAIRPLRLRLRD